MYVICVTASAYDISRVFFNARSVLWQEKTWFCPLNMLLIYDID